MLLLRRHLTPFVSSFILGTFTATSCASENKPSSADVAVAEKLSAVGAAGGGSAGDGGGGDTLTLNPTDPFKFPSTPVGKALADHMSLKMRTDGESVALYSASVAYLRANASEVAATLLAAYDQLPESQYLERWHVVQTLTALNLPEAATSLGSIVLRDVPPERWAPVQDGHSSRSEEAILRRRAITGLKSLAAAGSAEASEVLRQALNSPLPSIKIAAVQAYIAAGRRSPSRLAEVRSMLPEEQRSWIDIRPATNDDMNLLPPEAPPADPPAPEPTAPARPRNATP